MLRFWTFVFAFTGLSAFGQAVALEPQPLQCSDELFEGKSKYNEEISGIKCLATSGADNVCYIVADEKKALQQISINRTGHQSYQCQSGPVLAKKRGLACLKGKKPERDFEAIAADGRQLFITGSWGNQRKKHVGRSSERWVLVRQKLSGADRLRGDCQAVKRKDLQSFIKGALPALRPFMDAPLQCGGLNIEGLAVQKGKLFLGLRSPGIIHDGIGLIIETSADGIFSNKRQARLHRLAFAVNGVAQKGIGIRGLESLADGRFLIATGAGGVTMKNLSTKGENRIATQCAAERNSQAGPLYRNKVFNVPRALWLWTPASGGLKHLGDITGPYQHHKLESISLLAADKNKLDVVLAFDGVDNAERSPLATISIRLD